MLSIEQILELSDDNTSRHELKEHLKDVRVEVLSSFRKIVEQEDFLMVDVDWMVEEVKEDLGWTDEHLEPEVYFLTKTYMLNIF